MTIVYPGAIDVFGTIPPGTRQVEPIGSRTHRQQHNDEGDAIEALEAELGVFGSGAAGLSPLINGGFDVWQDGTSFASIADGTWGPDNWIYRKSGAVVHTLARSTDVPTVAQANYLPTYSLHLDVTTADASLAAGDFCAIATRLEGFTWRNFAQQIWSIGFWAKAAKTGRHYVYATNSGQDRSCVSGYDIIAADTWEYKISQFPASPSAGTWNYDTGRGIEIGWCLAAGATYHAAVGATWETGFLLSMADAVNEVDNAANNFRIALVGRPTLGLAPSRYRPADPGIELYRCKRYNEVMGGVANSVFGSGPCITTTAADMRIPMVPKRAAAPSFGALSGTIGNLSLYNGAGAPALTAIGDLAPGADNNLVRATVAGGLTAGQAVDLYAPGTEKLRIQSRIP